MIRRPRFLHGISPFAACPLFLWTAVALTAAGLALCARAWSLGLGYPHAPGPGLWPAVVGGGLAASGALLLTSTARQGVVRPQARPLPDTRALKGLVLGCAAWLLLFTSLGWLPATLAAGLIFARGAGNAWSRSLMLVLLIMAGLGLGVEHLLRFPLPSGLCGQILAALAAWLLGTGGPA